MCAIPFGGCFGSGTTRPRSDQLGCGSPTYGSRGVDSTGASNFRQVPIGVVVPHTVEAAVLTVAVCREHGFMCVFPVLLEGCGGAWTRAVALELDE